MGIDAAGYCTQCRTYRGLPQQGQPTSSYPQSYDVVPPAGGYPGGAPGGGYPGGAPGGGTVYGAPSSAPPSSGAPYSGPPQYGAPYGGPTSGAPYATPTSGAPYPNYGAPTSGAPYPATYGAPPTPTRTRPSFLVPLLALSATLVVLVVAIVVVVVVKSKGDNGGAGGGTTTTTTPTAASLVDTCVVGDWDETSHNEQTPIDGFVGKVTFTGSGALLHLKADGTGSYEYNGATYTGNGERAADNQTYEIKLKIDGKITFDYRTDNKTFSFSNMKATGSAVGFLNGQPLPGNQPLEPDTNPASYTCDGSNMKHTNSVYTIDWKRH
jgi:hypothetical protein